MPLRTLLLFVGLLAALPLQGQQPEDCVDVNAASVEELQRIIHIGPERAKQIMELRAQRPFASVEDLRRVSGIGPARLRAIQQQGVACVRNGRGAGEQVPPSPPARHRIPGG